MISLKHIVQRMLPGVEPSARAGKCSNQRKHGSEEKILLKRIHS